MSLTMLRVLVCLSLLAVACSAKSSCVKTKNRIESENKGLDIGNIKIRRTSKGKKIYLIPHVKCKDGYAANVRDIHTIDFKCQTGSWKASKDLENLNLYLSNITCQEKLRCVSPSPIPNGRYTIKQRYCYDVKGLPRCTGVYHNGDKITYSCDWGYKFKKIIKPAPIVSTTEYYDYFYGGVDEEEQADSVEELNPNFECDGQGLWRNDQEQLDSVPECEKIICNATRFENMTNGYIKNLTDSYEFGGMLELECDQGYSPIKNERLLQCLDPEEFDKTEFGCKKTKCPSLEDPIGGNVHYLNTSRYVGDIAMFTCMDYKAKLIGPKYMTCLENGKWDPESCVKCIPKDADCSPPCMHENNYLLTVFPKFTHGSVIEMSCRNKEDLAINRTCLITNRWDKSDLYCKEMPDPYQAVLTADSLAKAMQSIKPNATVTDDVLAKTIDVGAPGGVDVFFVLDVSGSIRPTQFGRLKEFTIALTKNLNVSDSKDGTRIAVYAFATQSKQIFNGHGSGTFEQDVILEDTDAAVKKLNDILNMTYLRADGGIGLGTNIKAVLSDIKFEIITKERTENARPFAQQVVVLISDGKFNVDGDPTDMATELKEDHEVEIYSIYVGLEGDEDGQEIAQNKETWRQTMKDIASLIPDETHFFDIGTENFKAVIEMMINRNTELPCGQSDPIKTNIDKKNTVRARIDARDNAWPWMVHFKNDKGTHFCGGSLIDHSYILTAAHCFKDKAPFEITLGTNKANPGNDEGNVVITERVRRESVIIHEKYNTDEDPQYMYDIALVHLKQHIDYTFYYKPVCLPEDGKVLQDITPDKTYGITTGWGGEADKLKQLQVVIKPDNDCTKNVSAKHLNEFDRTLMFCAGGEENKDGKAVDTVKGDSGGPFVIEDPLKENTFIQIGIVSFEIPGSKLGIYTKLNDELIKWIHETIKAQEDGAKA